MKFDNNILETFIKVLEIRENMLRNSLKMGAIPIPTDQIVNGINLHTYLLQFNNNTNQVI